MTVREVLKVMAKRFCETVTQMERLYEHCRVLV
jgi:hypothetical protein